jgi:hypothetical protein
VLGDYSGPGLEIELKKSCKITSAGASASAEVLDANQELSLDYCVIGQSCSRMGWVWKQSARKFLSACMSWASSRGVLHCGQHPRKGLVKFGLSQSCRINDETWGAIRDSS